MSKTVTMQITSLSANEVSDEDAERLKGEYGVDSLDKVAEEMEAEMESLVAVRLLGNADSIPVLDVTTEVVDTPVDDVVAESHLRE